MDEPQPQIVDLNALAENAASTHLAGAVWSLGSADLNLNLLHFAADDGVESHINAELDVVGVVIRGEGTLELESGTQPLRAGMLFFLPKGIRRAIHAGSGDFAYLTCHRRRAGLMPTRPAASPHAPRSPRRSAP